MSDPFTSCSECRHWSNGAGAEAGACLRHAPSVGDRPLLVARWPETRASDGCGEGRPRDPQAAAQGCGGCRFWLRPGSGIDPGVRGDHFAAWWRDAGFCRCHAPRPSFQAGAHAFWPVTHVSDRCHDGRPA